jgi:hypothetical protein
VRVRLGVVSTVAARTARFGVPEVKRSLVAGGGAALLLAGRVPRALAMELLLVGDPIDAERAAASPYRDIRANMERTPKPEGLDQYGNDRHHRQRRRSQRSGVRAPTTLQLRTRSVISAWPMTRFHQHEGTTRTLRGWTSRVPTVYLRYTALIDSGGRGSRQIIRASRLANLFRRARPGRPARPLPEACELPVLIAMDQPVEVWAMDLPLTPRQRAGVGQTCNNLAGQSRDAVATSPEETQLRFDPGSPIADIDGPTTPDRTAAKAGIQTVPLTDAAMARGQRRTGRHRRPYLRVARADPNARWR